MDGKSAIVTTRVGLNGDVLRATIPKKTCIELGIGPGDLVIIKIAKGQPPEDF